jgi:hypothetical protein
MLTNEQKKQLQDALEPVQGLEMTDSDFLCAVEALPFKPTVEEQCDALDEIRKGMEQHTCSCCNEVYFVRPDNKTSGLCQTCQQDAHETETSLTT